MWPFSKRNKESQNGRTALPCTFCGSKQTMVKAYQGNSEPDPVRTWRGQRYLTCRCLDCGLDFYAAEPRGGLPADVRTDEDLIDKDELEAAEKALKRQAESENDRRCR